MTIYDKLCDIIRNPIWRTIQDGGIVIFNAFLQYGYQMKGLVESKPNNVTSFEIQYERAIQDGGIVIFNAFLQYGYQMKGLVESKPKINVTSFEIQYGGPSKMAE